jgi:chromosome segregation ATPase
MSTWVIEDEKPVLASMKEARAVFQSYAQVAERKAEAEQAAATSKQLDQQRNLLQQNLNALNQEIASTPNPSAGVPSRMRRYTQQTAANNPLLAQKSELNAEINEVNQTQKMIKAQIPAPKDKATLDEEAKKRLEAFKTTLTDLRKQIDEVSKKYEVLAADPEVKKAIEEMSKATKARIKLGPSDAFANVVKEVDKAEQRYLGKTPPASTASTKKAKTKAKK